MKSKAVVFVCLLAFVSVLVLASAVSEGNQQQPANVEVEKANPVEDSKQRCYHGCCRYYGHRCVKCCGSAAEAQAYNNNNNNNNNAQQQEYENEKTWRGGGSGHGGHGGHGDHGGWGGGSGHGGKGGGGGGK